MHKVEGHVTFHTAMSTAFPQPVPGSATSPGQKFKSPVLDTDQQFAHRFDQAGTYKYFCSIHPKMTGQIVVG
jgi:plastocyanin